MLEATRLEFDKVRTIVQGEFAISSNQNEVFLTVLGSCIAACIYDEDAGVGGMNHFLLPGGTGGDTDSLRYGVNAMELLVNGLLRQGARRSGLRAKLFGGAKMMATRHHIGTSNAEFAQWFLSNESIPCVKHSLGGSSGRKIRFHPSSGQASQMLLTRFDEHLEMPKPKEKTANEDSGALDLF